MLVAELGLGSGPLSPVRADRAPSPAGWTACMLSSFSCTRCFATWTVACQAPLSMGFPRQEYRSGLHALLQGIFSNIGIEPESLRSPALAGGFFTTGVNLGSPHSLPVSAPKASFSGYFSCQQKTAGTPLSPLRPSLLFSAP